MTDTALRPAWAPPNPQDAFLLTETEATTPLDGTTVDDGALAEITEWPDVPLLPNRDGSPRPAAPSATASTPSTSTPTLPMSAGVTPTSDASAGPMAIESDPPSPPVDSSTVEQTSSQPGSPAVPSAPSDAPTPIEGMKPIVRNFSQAGSRHRRRWPWVLLFLLPIAVAVAVFALGGSGDGQGGSTGDPHSTTADRAADADQPGDGAATTTGQLTVGSTASDEWFTAALTQVVDPWTSEFGDLIAPANGARYVAVEFAVTNDAGDTHDLNPATSFRIADSAGAEGELVMDSLDLTPIAGTIAPGETRTGWQVFVVPEGFTPHAITIRDGVISPGLTFIVD